MSFGRAAAVIAIASAVIVLFLVPIGGEQKRLFGDGATFPLAQYNVWFTLFREETGIVVEYQGVGSGQGVKDFIHGLVDFCGSDPPLPHTHWVIASRKYGGVIQVPVVAGAIVVVYNVPGVPKAVHLNLTGEVLAEIFMGEVIYWDDPKIQALNPAVKLPHCRIIVVHRSDASGTTQYFTYYLSLSSRKWRERYGYSKVWPNNIGLGAQGNPGVAEVIRNTPCSIGYIELAYAMKYNLSYAAITPPNTTIFTLPTEESAARTLRAVASLLPAPDKDYSGTFGLTIRASTISKGYPLIIYTHLVFKKVYSKPKCVFVKKLLEWLYKVNVDKVALQPGYYPLPEPLAKKLREAANLIMCRT